MSALNKSSGGPAFPYAFQHEDSSHFTSQGFAPGMSMRDWLAGQAMVGAYAGNPIGRTSQADFEADAEMFYRIADAMLAARTKGAAS